MGPAHVAIQRAARYVNASRDARGRDQFRNDRDEPDTLTRAHLRAAWLRAGAACARPRAIALVCAALGGCTGEQFQKGYILPPGALEQIPIGASQDQVLIVMGTPSTVATLNGEVFYYISQRSERPVAFMNQKVIDQRVIAIYFDKNRQVRRLANYGLKDGKIFDFISRTTPTSRPGAQLPDAAVQAAQLQLADRAAIGATTRLARHDALKTKTPRLAPRGFVSIAASPLSAPGSPAAAAPRCW